MKTQGVKVADLLKLVQRDYEDTGKRSKYNLDLYINNQLLPKLGRRVANHVRKSHIEDYKSTRKREGASEVTINRELAALKRAFSLGIEDELIEHKPFIKLYPEPEPREGHYEHDEFLRFQSVCRQLGARRNFDGDVVADIVMFGYYSGWRLRECLGLHTDWIRVKDRLAVLPAAKHKNKRPKVYPLEGKVWQMVEQRLSRTNHEGLLFHRNGKPVKSIRRICMTVCDLAEIKNKEHFFHNLRRSCTTNINRAGVDKETGKKITGHLTDTVYHNYNQHSVDSLRAAVRKVEEFLDGKIEVSGNGGSLQEIPTQEKQVDSAPVSVQELPEVMAEREGFEPPQDDRPDLISSQALESNTAKREGFFSRIRRILTTLKG